MEIYQMKKGYNGDRLQAFEQADSYGFRDKWTGQVIISARYDEVKSLGFQQQHCGVRIGNEWFFIDTAGNVLTRGFRDVRSFQDNGYARVLTNKNRWGVINYQMQWMVVPQYQYISRFDSKGVAIAKQGWLYGFIDFWGNTLVPCKLSKIEHNGGGDFFDSKGFAVALNGRQQVRVRLDGKIIDYLTGEPARFHNMYYIPPGRHSGRVLKKIDNEQYRRYGIVMHDLDHYDLEDMDMYILMIEDQRDQWLEDLRNFDQWFESQRLSAIRDRSKSPDDTNPLPCRDPRTRKYGYVDSNRQWVIKPVYRHAAPFFEDLAVVEMANAKKGCIDLEGKLVIPAIYDSLGQCQDSMIRFTIGEYGEKLGFLDRSGKQMIPPRFKPGEVIGFVNGYAQVMFLAPGADLLDMAEGSSLYGLIDKQGRYVVPPVYHAISPPPENGLIEIRQHHQYGIYSIKLGRELVPPKYEWLGRFRENRCRFQYKGKFGFLDETGQVVIKPWYDQAKDFSNGYAWVERAGRSICIRQDGTYLSEQPNKRRI